MHIQRFTFVNGSVTFSGRMIETQNYMKSLSVGTLAPTITLSPVGPSDW